MESVHIKPRTQQQQQHRRGHCQQLQPQFHPQSQPPLLPLPIMVGERRHSMSLPGLIQTSSAKVIRAARKPKSHDHLSGSYKNNYQKIKSVCVKEQQLVSKKMIQQDRQITNNNVRCSNYVLNEDLDDCQTVAVSDLVFAMAPDPSSLPLPKFFMRQRVVDKLSCKAEATLGDGGSAAGIRRVFQLR